MFKTCCLSTVCALLPLLAKSCGQRPSPPDLTNCTRLEFHCPDGGLNYFFPSSALQEAIFSMEEKEHIGSFDAWAVSDRALISVFAQHVSQGTYWGRRAQGATSPGIGVACFVDDECVTRFAAYPGLIEVQDGDMFKYPVGALGLSVLDPTAMRPYKSRFHCASNLSWLSIGGPFSRREVNSYPDPNRWCDAVVDALRHRYSINAAGDGRKTRSYSDLTIATRFICLKLEAAAASEEDGSQSGAMNLSGEIGHPWRSDYAMNSNCRADSSADMVLLFETTPGWNQHGGLELFTFDNHDPRGGLVLLNDGTVKFIRTEDELKQLRWK